MQKELEKAKII
jgi:hypothetical protein